MSRVFPRLTKCDFHRFGPSGTIENYDALCVLGMNILNEKIFIFLWFWFLLMTLVTGLHLIMKIALLFIPALRRIMMIQITAFARNTDAVVHNLSFSDWVDSLSN